MQQVGAGFWFIVFTQKSGYCDTAFNPMIEPIKVVIKRILKNVAGSLNTKMPINAVPTAPMPVHTAYAVPMGNVWVAFTSKTMLMVSETRKPAYHTYISFPVVSLALPKHEANATSNSPAITRMIQFIVFVVLWVVGGLCLQNS